MIAKHVPIRRIAKSNFRALVAYLTDGQGKAVRVGAVAVVNCHSDRPDFASTEISNTQALNTRAQSDKTYHLVVSFREGERPDAATLRAIEKRLCEGLGYGDHQRVSVVHSDTDNLHIHIAINKIHPIRHTIYIPYNDHKTLGKLCERLEVEYGLQGDNHLARQRGAQSKATDMEAHAGVESLIGWIRRQCVERMDSARSWTELHRVMRENGLELRARGNGLVVTADDGTSVKASSIGRTYSKTNLEARFGPFESEEAAGQAPPTGRQYRARPLGSGADTGALYRRYCRERQERGERRTLELSEARARATREIEAAKAAARVKRAAVRLLSRGGGGRFKRFIYTRIGAALQARIDEIRHRHRRERARIAKANRRYGWGDWLRAQAIAGDAAALDALRCRAGGAAPAAGKGDGIARRGTIVYRVGAAAVRDDGNCLAVSRGADRPALETALRLAAARGPEIRVTGTAAFQARVVETAASAALPIRFHDPALEQRRQRLIEARAHDIFDADRAAAAERGRGTGCSVGNAGPDARDPRGLGADRPAESLDSVGLFKPDVAAIGREPPPQARNRLRAMSELGMARIAGRGEMLLPGHVSGDLEHRGPAADRRVRRPVSRAEAGLAAARRYIAEREEKRNRGMAVPKHILCEPDKRGGEAHFAGVREIDGQRLALLQQQGDILVLPIDAGTAQRLTRTRLGDAVSIVPAGGIRTGKGRSR